MKEKKREERLERLRNINDSKIILTDEHREIVKKFVSESFD
jgi:hypothetical protein